MISFLRGQISKTLACVALLLVGMVPPALAQTTNPFVFGAWYGTENTPLEVVGGASVAAKIRYQQQITGGAVVVVPATMNAFFGADPVPNMPKVVAVFIRHNGVNYNLRQVEGRALRFPGVEGQDYTFGKLDIVSASYGPPGTAPSVNVLNRVLANMKTGVIAVPGKMNEFFGGDPAPNVPKQFSVTVRHQGKLYEFRQVEGQDFRFPGTQGQDYQLPVQAQVITPPPPVQTASTSNTATNTGNTGDTGELFEDIPDMSEIEIQMVMEWIKIRATSAKLPFCWRQSDPRGVGSIPGRVADCPSGYTNNGATCGRGANTIAAPSRLADCPSGYTNMGLSCFRNAHTVWKGCKAGGCAAGYTDFGCTCTRGPDSMAMSAMVCAPGFFKGADGRCHHDCPSGYTNTGETCFRPVSTLGMDKMLCRPGERKVGARCFPATGSCYGDEQEQNGLCYRNCKPGFTGEGPVCWQQCQPGWVNCAAGCAKSSGECAKIVGEQIYAPVVVAANIATLGLSSTATAGTQATVTTLTIGNKTISSTSKVGKALITLITKARSMNVQETLPLTRRIFNAKLGTAQGASTFTTLRKVGMTTYKGTAATWQSIHDYVRAYAEDFANQTSPEINDIINKSFHPDTARFLKETWARQQFVQMATAEGWIAADNALNWIGMVDITGVTGLVSAYAKPICQDATELPCTSANLNCKSVFANLQAPPPVELKVTPLSKFSCWDHCAANPERGLSGDVADKVCGNAAQCESMCGFAGTAQACLAATPPRITQRECKDIPGAACNDGYKPPAFSCSECTTTEGLCANLGRCARQCNNELKWGEGQLETTVFNPLTWANRLTTQANICFTRQLLTSEVCAANSPAKRCRTVAIDPPPGSVRVADGSKSMVSISTPGASPAGTFAYLAQNDMILSDSENSMMRMDPNGVVSTYTRQMDGSWQLAASLGRRKAPSGGNYFLQLAWYGQICVASGDPTGNYTLQNCIRNRAEPLGRYQLVVKDPVRVGDPPAIELYVLENVEGTELRKSVKPNYNSVDDGWKAR